MRRYRLVILSVSVLILLFLAGCPERGQRKPVTLPTKIAVSLADMSRDGNRIIKKIMQERRKKEQLDITFMDAKNDPAEQEKHIDKMIQDKVKAAVIQFVDPASAPRLVQKLKQENIKVVALENLPVNTPVDGYIASNHTRAGELQVRFVQEALTLASQGGGQGGQGGGQQGGQQGQPGGRQQGQQDPAQVTRAIDPALAFQLPRSRPLKVLILQGDNKDRAAREITAANVQAVKANPDLSLLMVQDHPRWDPALATATLSQLTASGKQPDVVLANDSSLAMAAVQFLKQAGMDKKVITVGVGADKKASQAVMSGEHDGEVDPMPEMLGQYALDAAGALAKEGHWQFDRYVQNGDYDVPAKIIPARLIGRNNIYLLQDRWKGLKKQQEQQQRGGGQQGGGQQDQQAGGQQGQQGQGGTTLKITTQEGKVMEVKIDGTIKKIESVEERGKEQGGGQTGG